MLKGFAAHFIVGTYTPLSDVWAFGILMWEVFSCGQLPYTGMSNKETMEKIPKGMTLQVILKNDMNVSF